METCLWIEKEDPLKMSQQLKADTLGKRADWYSPGLSSFAAQGLPEAELVSIDSVNPDGLFFYWVVKSLSNLHNFFVFAVHHRKELHHLITC